MNAASQRYERASDSLMSLISFNLHAVERNILIPIYYYYFQQVKWPRGAVRVWRRGVCLPLSIARRLRRRRVERGIVVIAVDEPRGRKIRDGEDLFFRATACLRLFSSERVQKRARAGRGRRKESISREPVAKRWILIMELIYPPMDVYVIVLTMIHAVRSSLKNRIYVSAHVVYASRPQTR